MENTLKNKKGNKKYPSNSINNQRSFNYSLTTDRFVVPWQLDKNHKSAIDDK
jgi:hypothetical protein